MKYSEIVQAPKLAVRRKTVHAMVESEAVVDGWIAKGLLEPINKGDSVELYLVVEVQRALANWVKERR